MTEKSITVTFGPGNSITTAVPSHYTVGDVLRDERIRAALRFGDDVKALVDRVEQGANAPLTDGDTINLERRASIKGS